jgi:SAM-dependent methyltransferase
MGSGSIQGPLWGTQAEVWAELAEPGQTPFYEAVFDVLDIADGARMLDVGCGAGLALQLAAKRGATVTGLDASAGMIAIARQRLPHADIRLGDLEDLPFPDASFTVLTSFNAVQYASDARRALGELGRVARAGAPIAIVTWGDPERSEMRDVLGAIGGLLPPPPPGAGGPFALSRPGALEDLVQGAGLVPKRAGEVPTPYLYPDVDTAVRAQTASGPAVRAAQHAGQEALHDALTEVMTRYRQPDGTVRLDNVFRYLVATNTQ